MRKTLALLLSCLLLTACARQAVTPRSGHYHMSVPPETLIVPGLTLDTEAGTFLLSYDGFSSYLPVGTFEQEGTELRCRTDDGRYTYLFRVVDETTLAFIADGSADMTLIDDRSGAPVADGSLFLLAN
ncbi:MAG: hypothetical protein J1E43_08305 [Christensenellaceae bacterium]|nr:hypothetical protein [Christensenellaceae bacterium]